MSVLPRPRLRGVLHLYSFFVSLGSGVMLVVSASTGLARLSSVIYALALAGVLGVSALYHRNAWRPRTERWMRRLDHSMIFVFIASTYTPIALLLLSPPFGLVLLGVVWAAAIAGIAFHLAWVDAPRWLSALTYLLLGWVAITALPELVRQANPLTLVLLALGGALYSAGAVIYATKRPDPAPLVFGYHEVFHGLTIAAAGIHFAAVASVVLVA